MKYIKLFPFTWATIALILYLSLSKIPESPLDDVPNIDKLVHTAMYGFLCLVIWLERARQRQPVQLKHTLIGAFLLPVVLGGAIELAQEYCTDCRQGSWWDFAANSLGVMIIWFVVWPLRRRISL